MSPELYLRPDTHRDCSITDTIDCHQGRSLSGNKLAYLLQSSNIDAIYSTNYIRTESTAEPLANMLGIEIQNYETYDSSFIDDVIDEHKGKNILIVGHSNTIPDLVNELIDEEKYKDLVDSEYNKIFVVTISNTYSKSVILQY